MDGLLNKLKFRHKIFVYIIIFICSRTDWIQTPSTQDAILNGYATHTYICSLSCAQDASNANTPVQTHTLKLQ
jgi:hypothetical protein